MPFLHDLCDVVPGPQPAERLYRCSTALACQFTSRGAIRRSVLVSPEFYDRALRDLEGRADIRAAIEARSEEGRVGHEDLMRELDL